MPTRTIDLSDYLDSFIESSIASGRYRNASEVVRDSLSLLEQQKQEDDAKLKKLKAEVQIGFEALERGEYIEVTEDGLRDLIADLGRQAGERVKRRRSQA